MTPQEKLRAFFSITFLNIWWVAIWGISYLAIEMVAQKNKAVELFIYITLMIIVIGTLIVYPDLIPNV
jgi:hypothetical protein